MLSLMLQYMYCILYLLHASARNILIGTVKSYSAVKGFGRGDWFANIHPLRFMIHPTFRRTSGLQRRPWLRNIGPPCCPKAYIYIHHKNCKCLSTFYSYKCLGRTSDLAGTTMSFELFRAPDGKPQARNLRPAPVGMPPPPVNPNHMPPFAVPPPRPGFPPAGMLRPGFPAAIVRPAGRAFKSYWNTIKIEQFNTTQHNRRDNICM